MCVSCDIEQVYNIYISLSVVILIKYAPVNIKVSYLFIFSVIFICALPSTRHHQFNFDSVGHQDPQDLLVGDVLHTETHKRALRSCDCSPTHIHVDIPV